jgi:hypothetical protein
MKNSAPGKNGASFQRAVLFSFVNAGFQAGGWTALVA